MTPPKRLLTAAAAITIAALAAPVSAAADPSRYATYYAGAFADQATCNADSADQNDPPSELTEPCHYWTSDPDLINGNQGPGWYYVYHVFLG